MRRIVPTPLERCAPALTALTIVWALAACEGVIGEGGGGPTPVDPTRADGGNVESMGMGETPLHCSVPLLSRHFVGRIRV
jgi:hypothetical protein